MGGCLIFLKFIFVFLKFIFNCGKLLHSVVLVSAISDTSFLAAFRGQLFIYLWLYWVFVAAHGLSLTAASGSYSMVVVHRLSFPCGASLVVEHGL